VPIRLLRLAVWNSPYNQAGTVAAINSFKARLKSHG